jgi:hypothetical protein
MDATLESAFRHAPAREHTALFYRDQREQFAAAVPFIRTGIERGEQCFYLTGDDGPDTVRDALRGDGLDVDALAKAGALMIKAGRDVYLPNGRFDKDAMLPFWEAAAKEAIASGYTALRATGDLGWALSDVPGSEDVIAYERALEDHYRRLPVMVLCRYNSAMFPEEIVDEARKTHARVIVDGVLKESPLYVPPHGGLNWSSEAFAALVTPYADGELPESMAAQMAERIRNDASLRRLYEAELAIKRRLRASARHGTALSALPRRIRQALFGPGQPDA